VFFDPRGRIVHRSALPQGARVNRHREIRDGDGFGLAQEVNAQVGLLARPWISIPDPARDEGVVIARDDEHRTGIARAFQNGEGSGRVRTGHAVIIKDIAGDDDKVYPKSSGMFAELLQRGKAGLADPVAGVLLKSRDPQTKMKIRGVKETDHAATLLGNIRRWPSSPFILILLSPMN
jgi:hypothetical protein